MSEDFKARYEELCSENLNLDITRGQPSVNQFDLSNEVLTTLSKDSYISEDGVDCRNYGGGVLGIKEARELFSEVLGASVAETMVANNSSLNLMSDVLKWFFLRGVGEGKTPWVNAGAKMIAAVPGYDRHFTVCDSIGMELVSVQMLDDGPDMDAVEKLVASDPSFKSIILVPQYSNPTGCVFSDEVVDRLAGMKTAADDFRIIWDNAYAIHHLVESPRIVKNLLSACKEAGNPDRALMFSSTSKVTFASAGLGYMATSEANMKYLGGLFSTQIISPDKLNQLRHVKFLNAYPGGLSGLMRHHQESLAPKFLVVDEVLAKEFTESEDEKIRSLAEWTKPEGGYFISLDVPKGLAKRVVELAGNAGVKLTQAGATYPHGNDPEDKNIRIAPSKPAVGEVKLATEVLAACVKLAASEKGLI